MFVYIVCPVFLAYFVWIFVVEIFKTRHFSRFFILLILQVLSLFFLFSFESATLKFSITQTQTHLYRKIRCLNFLSLLLLLAKRSKSGITQSSMGPVEIGCFRRLNILFCIIYSYVCVSVISRRGKLN